jgi:hypothetical protein
MGYASTSQARWMSVQDLLLHASAQESADGAGPSVETDRGVARLTLDVTNHSGDGTQTLDVDVETSEDDATWRTVDSFTQVGNSTGSERLAFAGLDRFVRVSWTIGGSGSPSFTFSVAGEAA